MDSDFANNFEDWAKFKILSVIKPPFIVRFLDRTIVIKCNFQAQK